MTISISDLIDNFTFGTFEEWKNIIIKIQNLALEASLALDQFLKTLNKFFDDIEDIDDDNIQPMTLIKWYTICTLSNREYACTKS